MQTNIPNKKKKKKIWNNEQLDASSSQRASKMQVEFRIEHRLKWMLLSVCPCGLFGESPGQKTRTELYYKHLKRVIYSLGLQMEMKSFFRFVLISIKINMNTKCKVYTDTQPKTTHAENWLCVFFKLFFSIRFKFYQNETT